MMNKPEFLIKISLFPKVKRESWWMSQSKLIILYYPVLRIRIPFFTVMRFWIQVFTLMPIRIRLPNMVLIHPDPVSLQVYKLAHLTARRSTCTSWYLVSGDLVKGLADSQHPALDFSLKQYEIMNLNVY
jgi:hypothetical protein